MTDDTQKSILRGFEIVADGRGHKRWQCCKCRAHGAWSMYSNHKGNAEVHMRKNHTDG